MSKLTCKHCAFFRDNSCLRYPPKVWVDTIMDPYHGPRINPEWANPYAGEDDWCGEFQVNPVLVGAVSGLLEACRKATQLRGMALALINHDDPCGEDANRLHAEMNNITEEIKDAIAKAEGK